MSKHVKLAAAFTALSLFAVSPAFAEDPAWISKVKKLLASKQTYPEVAQDHGEQGTATIKISVTGDGKLQGVELVSGSGSRSLDREAVQLPSKIGTFPAPGNASSLTVPLTWKLS